MLTLEIDIGAQRLTLRRGDQRLLEAPVSTGANGSGEINGSGCTPRGRHVVRARIGAGVPPGGVFRARRYTGEIWTPEAHAAQPGRDWILTRILWLSGTEPGINRLGCVDTFRRYIYLHGTPPVTPLGTPGSRGCIRTDNTVIMQLYDLVSPGTPVMLHD